jgi:hypothetical protein
MKLLAIYSGISPGAGALRRVVRDTRVGMRSALTGWVAALKRPAIYLFNNVPP